LKTKNSSTAPWGPSPSCLTHTLRTLPEIKGFQASSSNVASKISWFFVRPSFVRHGHIGFCDELFPSLFFPFAPALSAAPPFLPVVFESDDRIDLGPYAWVLTQVLETVRFASAPPFDVEILVSQRSPSCLSMSYGWSLATYARRPRFPFLPLPLWRKHPFFFFPFLFLLDQGISW